MVERQRIDLQPHIQKRLEEQRMRKKMTRRSFLKGSLVAGGVGAAAALGGEKAFNSLYHSDLQNGLNFDLNAAISAPEVKENEVVNRFLKFVQLSINVSADKEFWQGFKEYAENTDVIPREVLSRRVSVYQGTIAEQFTFNWQNSALKEDNLPTVSLKVEFNNGFIEKVGVSSRLTKGGIIYPDRSDILTNQYGLQQGTRLFHQKDELVEAASHFINSVTYKKHPWDSVLDAQGNIDEVVFNYEDNYISYQGKHAHDGRAQFEIMRKPNPDKPKIIM